MTNCEAIAQIKWYFEEDDGIAAEGTTKEAANMAIKALDQPERKQGKWEEEMFDDLAIERWQSARCSVCGLYHTTPYMYYFSNYNYCPNCGADMRKEQTDG